MTLLVVGAGGHVGGAVARSAAAAGEKVDALVRRPAAGLPDGTSVYVGDARRGRLGLGDDDATALAERVTAIVVGVGAFDPAVSPAAAQTEHLVPLRGVLRFAETCKELRTVVLVSSVLAPGRTDRLLRSDTRPDPVRHRNFYEWAKFEGERIARAAPVPVDVVRAGHVLAAADGSAPMRRPAALFDLLPLLLSGWPLPVVGTARYWCAPADFAAAVVLDRAAVGTGGSSVWAVDPASPTVGEIVDLVNARYGTRTRRIRSRRLSRLAAAAVRPDRLDLRAGREILDYATSDVRLSLDCLLARVEAGAVTPPADRGYLVRTLDHEIARLRGDR